MSAAELSRSGLARARLRDEVMRFRGRLVRRRYDLEFSQLRDLRRAYSGARGPEVLVLGDSSMVYVHRTDPDRRRLVDMIRDEVPGRPSFLTVAGPGFNPRIIMAYLEVLAQARSQPRAVVVPLYPTVAMDIWLHHPKLGYQTAADQILRAVREPGYRPRRRIRPTDEAEAAYDERPTPSFEGTRRTCAELRLMTNVRPLTGPQRRARARHLMDSYYSQRLTVEDVGPRLITQMAQKLATMGLPSLAYVAAVDSEQLAGLFGAGVEAHMRHNADVMIEAFRAGCGSGDAVVDATFGAASARFRDPVHLDSIGRRACAPMYAEALQALLAGGGAPRAGAHPEAVDAASLVA